MPFSLACFSAPRMPVELLGVIRMPFTPCWTRFSIAATWPSLSPSNLPATAISVAPLAAAAAFAPIAQLDEVRVGVGLGDEADLDRAAAVRAVIAA